MFVFPSDPIPSAISFGPTQGCTDLVLLDESFRVISRGDEGATGIVGFITSQSATHYLENDDATKHMFRPWDRHDMLLYTDDIGCMQADGTIVIKGRSSRNVKINGLFIDLDYIERALTPAFAQGTLKVTSFKLVKSNATEKIVLFASTDSTDALFILKQARDALRAIHGDDLAMIIGGVRCIAEMPFNASYKIDLAKLQRIADDPELFPLSFPDALIECSASSRVDTLAAEIATEIARLCKSKDPVSVDGPLLYSGLNSITVVRLFFWLQSEHEYEEELSHLFEEEVTPLVLAMEILGDEVENIYDNSIDEIVIEPASPASQATIVDEELPKLTALEAFADDFDKPFQLGKCEPTLDEIDIEPSRPRPVSTLVVMQPLVEPVPEAINDVANHPTLHVSAWSFLFLTWLTPLLTLGSKRPLLESVVIFTSG